MAKLKEEPHIVEVYHYGNTIVQIADNFCRNKTHEDGEKVMAKIVQLALDSWARQAIQEQEERERKQRETEPQGDQ